MTNLARQPTVPSARKPKTTKGVPEEEDAQKPTGGGMVLEGQVAVVTGGGRGIGKAIALRFAREGADIAVLDVNGETAEVTGREVRDLGRRAVIKVTDGE